MSLTRRPTMTAKRIAAVRANGQLSRGPRTPEGRARTVAACMRHGFYAHSQNEILEALGEDPLQFQELLDSLIETWQPENQQEMGLVMRLARAMWRMERADRIQESLILEQVYRALPKPTLLKILDGAISARANKVLILASRICEKGHFAGPEDFQLFAEVYGNRPEDADEEPQAILLAMRRLMKPGAEGASPLFNGEKQGEATLPEDEELRQAERQKLLMALLKQIAKIQPKSIAGDDAQDVKGQIHSHHGVASLMAPQDRNGPLMLMQRWEDSNLRQVLRITELLTKMKNGKLGWNDDEK